MAKEKQKRINKKTGKIDAGKGKVRPHHREVDKLTRKSLKERPATPGGEKEAFKHRRTIQDHNYIPRTPNKYQTQPKIIHETKESCTYQWFEDNGHKDHLQLKRKQVCKGGVDADGHARGTSMVAATITNPVYQENFKEIFGDKKRGVECAGGYKKFKKTYK